MKESCKVIFDAELEPLGEVHLRDGACAQISLNGKGEMLLGPSLSIWQVSGVAHPKPVALNLGGIEAKAWCMEKIKLSSPAFGNALNDWLEENGYHHLTMPIGAMAAFSQIQEMELPPEKKYELAVMLRELPVEKMEAAF